jgi:hypothetical protein
MLVLPEEHELSEELDLWEVLIAVEEQIDALHEETMQKHTNRMSDHCVCESSTPTHKRSVGVPACGC